MKMKEILTIISFRKFTLFFVAVFVTVISSVLAFNILAQDKSKEKVSMTVLREKGQTQVPTTQEVADSKKGIKDRLVKKLADVNVPVEITKLKVKGNAADFDKPLKADDNWVDGLSVEIKNVSNREIIYAYIKLNFPVDDSYKRFLTIPLHYGLPQSICDENLTISPLQPGESVTLTISPEMTTALTRRLQREATKEFQKKNQARIFVDQIWFDTNTMWTAGDTTFIRDQTDKKKWNKVGQTSSISPKKEREPHFTLISLIVV